MSTITKERLEPVIERLEHYATNVKWTNVQAAKDMLIAVDAMRRLLASLEAEPVSVFKIDHESSLIKHVKKVVSETNAPPAPVSVPDENGLLPCPFCGGRPEEDAGGCSEYDGHEHQDYSINCKSCGAEVYCAVGSFEKADIPCSCHHNAREVCVEKWNRRAAMLQGAEHSKMSGIMPDYEGGVMTQREFFQAGWEAHHAAMLRAGSPVQFGWSKGHFGYHTLFNAISKAVNIQGGAISISVSAFEDAMLAAAPKPEA